jgi:hypothetical protein
METVFLLVLTAFEVRDGAAETPPEGQIFGRKEILKLLRHQMVPLGPQASNFTCYSRRLTSESYSRVTRMNSLDVLHVYECV